MTNTQESRNVINLEAVTGGVETPFLSGKERGQQARRFFSLDEIEAEHEEITVVLPEFLEGISSSFTLGLLSSSVQKYGSVDAFMGHYQFSGKQPIIADMIAALRRGEAGPPRI